MQRIAGLDIPRSLEEACDPRRMALVVYDMQVGILRQLKSADAIVACVSEELSAARAAGVRVFFMRHMSLPMQLMGAFAYRMAMAWQRIDDPDAVQPWFLRDSPEFAITPELAPRASEAIFDKLTMSALEGCGAGHADAAARSIEALKFAGDAIITDSDALCQALQRHPA